MKKLILIIAVFFSVTTQAQTHPEKMAIATDSAFSAKVTLAAFEAAKAFVADTQANANVKRFSQTIVTTIAHVDNNIIIGLGYYLLSIPETVSLNINSTQNDISYGMPFVYQLFAKAWYKDISN